MAPKRPIERRFVVEEVEFEELLVPCSGDGAHMAREGDCTSSLLPGLLNWAKVRWDVAEGMQKRYVCYSSIETITKSSSTCISHAKRKLYHFS